MEAIQSNPFGLPPELPVGATHDELQIEADNNLIDTTTVTIRVGLGVTARSFTINKTMLCRKIPATQVLLDRVAEETMGAREDVLENGHFTTYNAQDFKIVMTWVATGTIRPLHEKVNGITGETQWDFVACYRIAEELWCPHLQDELLSAHHMDILVFDRLPAAEYLAKGYECAMVSPHLRRYLYLLAFVLATVNRTFVAAKYLSERDFQVRIRGWRWVVDKDAADIVLNALEVSSPRLALEIEGKIVKNRKVEFNSKRVLLQQETCSYHCHDHIKGGEPCDSAFRYGEDRTLREGVLSDLFRQFKAQRDRTKAAVKRLVETPRQEKAWRSDFKKEVAYRKKYGL